MTLSRLLALPLVVLWHALFWTYDRATWQYDLMVIAILAFRVAHSTRLVGRSHGRRPRACSPGCSPFSVDRSRGSDVFSLVVRTEVQALAGEVDVVGSDLVAQQAPSLTEVLMRDHEPASESTPAIDHHERHFILFPP